jgi:hypothetical protein
VLLALAPGAARAEPQPPQTETALTGPEKTPPCSGACSPEERALEAKFGASFLAGLARRGIKAKDFLYAERLARVGLKNLERRELGDAMYLFRKAYKLVKSPNLLYYTAQTLEQLGSHLKAREHYARFAVEAGQWKLTKIDPAKVALARRKHRALERKLVALELAVSPEGTQVFVNGEPAGKAPVSVIWLLPGTNRLVLIKKGYEKKEIVLAESRQGLRVRRRVELLTPEQAVKASRHFRAEQERKRRLQLELRAGQKSIERRARLFRISGYTVGGVGLAALITGGVLGALAGQSAERVETAKGGTPWSDVKEDYDRHGTYRTGAYVTLGVGAGLLALGAAGVIYGYLSPRRERDTPRVSLRVGPSRAGLSLSF